MPAFIVIVASFVTIVQFWMEGFVPSLYESLGIYIPLIVVNCIILGRAESYASKNPVLPSIFDGIGMGLGFTFGLTCIASVFHRNRSILRCSDSSALCQESYEPVTIFILAQEHSLFLHSWLRHNKTQEQYGKQKGKKVAESSQGCGEGGCASCGGCEGQSFPRQGMKRKEE